MFFTVSKVGWLLVQPLGLVAIALVVLVVLAIRRRAMLSTWIAAFALAVLLVATQTNVGRLLLQPLEDRYARPDAVPDPADIAGIIVLGGGFDGSVTLGRGGYELGEAGDRFVEAVRLARLYPDAPVIVSGGEASLIGVTEGDAAIARRFFAHFGLDSDRLLLETHSKNTHENAVYTKNMLPDESTGDWLLITSAFHMPRSVGVFKGQGVSVVPWPVDYRTSGTEELKLGRDDPVSALSELSQALREYLGLLVYRMTGRIGRNVEKS
ncbi:YdcF family protein [Oricola thermophila]|uniref:YdcF family protein n=1 Tax=Oricola thermophila TaxID=2742145 RepID=A0A6N1VGG7_9HYPH|nr:YdcF family protein [Oricola thermophila]QKV18087.1 YdcF family protein [Oricola thermophila]